ncbi:hypothetical protein GT037_006099 [Alternaria burnsii]|uniref:Uncharacterized protein n=1 Tax=Alternaria burnsii TaxID=1187904 RepID=A0A8H7B2W9_9PLEO|nr:uncharacterized protein GT037_006099 [Alternaria burnsii]KAF7675380.1 hypothetical protein GT037_006099 [Alternaria burnsii]
MSDRGSKPSSPTRNPKPTGSCTTEVTQTTTSSAAHPGLEDISQSTSEQPLSTPVIVVTRSPASSRAQTPESGARQGHPLVIRHRSRSSSPLQLQRQERSPTPYERPQRSQSQPLEASIPVTNITMSSSGSSPSGTSSAGSNSGSGQLPYAPFPYPMPANPRGGSSQGSQGK